MMPIPDKSLVIAAQKPVLVPKKAHEKIIMRFGYPS